MSEKSPTIKSVDADKQHAELLTDITTALRSPTEISTSTLLRLARQCCSQIRQPPAAVGMVEESLAVIESGGLESGLVPAVLSQYQSLLQQQAQVADYFWLINELRASQGKRLLSELIFSLPADSSAATNDALVSVLPSASDQFDSAAFSHRFNQILQALFEGENGPAMFEQLAALCRQNIDADTHEYAAIFWLTCSCYVACIELQTQTVSAAHRLVLRQIELIINQHVLHTDTAILVPEGIELVELTMCNMLSYIATRTPDVPVFETLETKFQMHRSLASVGKFRIDAANGEMLDAGVQKILRTLAQLKLKVDALPDSSAQASQSAIDTLVEISDACALLVSAEDLVYFHSALSSLYAYHGNDGAVSDLERCAASLINAERTLTHIASDQTDTGLTALQSSDERQLDQKLRTEMVRMLEPIADIQSVESVDREWIVVALTDVLSLSAFLADDTLLQPVGAIRRSVESVQSPLSTLVELATAVKDVLAQSLVDSDDSQGLRQAQEKLHSCVEGFSESVDFKTSEVPADWAELASDNADLLGLADPPAAEAKQVEPQLPGAGGVTSLEFGDQCNRYVDTIQLALDSALGSSGNLSPDKTVTTALGNLYQVVRDAEHDPLLRLLEPLSQVLSSAESAGSTLNQADTLLVQEAIVAITIGLDAVVNEQPMPALVADVAERITRVAVEDAHNSRGRFEATGLVDVFIEEAEELGQRLFELFQRWRSAPLGGSRIQTDIKRLLHTLKGSADTVGLSHIAAISHAIESYIARDSSSTQVQTSVFFDTVIDAIEVVLDDIDRVRNGESVLSRHETLASLDAAAAATSALSESGNHAEKEAPAKEFVDPLIDRAPAFGSVKYFSQLEKSQRALSRSCWESQNLQNQLKLQLADMQSSLLSTRHLLGKIPKETIDSSVYRGLNESVDDLYHLQSDLRQTMAQLNATEEQQLAHASELESLVLTADRISVESIRLRMESLVQNVAAAQRKSLQFEFEGADLELDRKLFADINVPLEQLLTNAVVHGIESSAVRLSKNKAPKATIKVSFKVINDRLTVSVSDDGGGIDMPQLRKQLANHTELAHLAFASEAEVLAAIVEQGVTTSSAADHIAGRGVGLDIVREWVSRYFGELAVASTADKGTRFSIDIPLPAVAVAVMVIRQGDRYFAIDIDQVAEIQDAAEAGVSLAAVLALEPGSETTALNCIAGEGLVTLKVDHLIGRKTIKFGSENQLLDKSGFYRGAGLMDNRHVVLRLCMEKLSKATSDDLTFPATQTNRASVLIVDDSVTIRASFGRAMQAAGYEIVLARNGLEAMEYLKVNQPEAIILDLEMPLMDGYELGTYIREHPRLSRSALIVVSSKPRSIVGEWLSAVNADAYYEKPCSETVIAGAVAGLA